MKTDTHFDIYSFPECRSIVVCGDIHGDFKLLVNKVCMQYQMRDTLVINHKRFTAIPDYSVVKANRHTILCVGGAISIDRQHRKEAYERNQRKTHRQSNSSSAEGILAQNYYWPNEAPVFKNGEWKVPV